LPEYRDSPITQIRDFKQRYHHPLKLKQPLEQPDKDAYRILFLGDSFTYGMGKAEYSFPRLVQEYFQKGGIRGIPSRKVQSFNLGRISYSPSIYGILLRDYEPLLKPHLIIVAVDDSDPQDDYYYHHFLIEGQDDLPLTVFPGLPWMPEFLKPLAREFKTIRLLFAAMEKSFHLPKLEDSFYGKWENRIDHYKPGGAKRWKAQFSETLKRLDAIVRYCQRNKIDLVLVNYPYAPAVTKKYNLKWRERFSLNADQNYEPVFHDVQKKYAAVKKIPYYDFTDYLRRLPSLEGIYFEDNGHFTDQGNILFAQEIVKLIDPILNRNTGSHLSLRDH